MCNCVCNKPALQDDLTKLLNNLRQQIKKQMERNNLTGQVIRDSMGQAYSVYHDLIDEKYSIMERSNKGQFALTSLHKLVKILNCDLRITLLPKD